MTKISDPNLRPGFYSQYGMKEQWSRDRFSPTDEVEIKHSQPTRSH